VLLSAGAPEAATPKPITGKLSKGGYTVIALAANGKATSVRAPRGSFKLNAPAPTVTLHLRGSNGRYAGPIVVGVKGKLAVVGVKRGAKLGTIRVRSGYARVAKRVPRKYLDLRRLARARKGVPIGAGVFGRVAVRGVSQGAGSAPRGLDPDRDGVPNALDIDDDGDRVLDNFELQATGRAVMGTLGMSQTQQQPQPSGFVFHSLSLALFEPANVHAGPVTTEQIDSILPIRGGLAVAKVPGDARELDCGGLVYCSLGGTGRVGRGPDPSRFPGERFPECCDPDGDGFGSIDGPHGNAHLFFLGHGATSAQIRTGDVLIERVTTGGVESEFPVTLQSVIATVPALVSYSDGQGTSVTIPYPNNPHDQYPVKAGPGGQVVVTMTLWRPQRKPIPPETAEWIDVGGLMYQVHAACTPGAGPGCSPPQEACPQDAYATADPNLGGRPASLPAFHDGALSDLASDRPASPTNTLTFSINLTRCLAVNGLSWAPGEGAGFRLKGFNATAAGITDLVEQVVPFKLQ
jgi:hypothetical protein